ncbi:hypothetical protein WJX74_005420 [Apatococcus lobatus]|uniref:Uncharacterized protein n=1 Tax=Apatococcus lobatus TaxID=904363 RepID=A0AAW1QX04_9CHLO
MPHGIPELSLDSTAILVKVTPSSKILGHWHADNLGFDSLELEAYPSLLHPRPRPKQVVLVNKPPGWSQEFTQERKQHVSSLRDTGVASALASLQQPDGPPAADLLCRANVLQSLNHLMHQPGSEPFGQAYKMRMSSVQGMLVHPGWHAVTPCDHISKVYVALEAGHGDLPLDLSGVVHKHCTSLRHMTSLPQEEHSKLFARVNFQIVQAMAGVKSRGDAAHQAMLSYTGGICAAASIIFQQQGHQHFLERDLQTGEQLHRHSALEDAAGLQDRLWLDSHQVKMARHIWKQAAACLASLEAERLDILSKIQLADAPPATWQGPASITAARTQKLLEQVAELKENALMQQEVIRHCCRVTGWQVLSPESAARVIYHSWPSVPDLFATLKAIASIPEP